MFSHGALPLEQLNQAYLTNLREEGVDAVPDLGEGVNSASSLSWLFGIWRGEKNLFFPRISVHFRPFHFPTKEHEWLFHDQARMFTNIMVGECYAGWQGVSLRSLTSVYTGRVDSNMDEQDLQDRWGLR